jgi:hypothetical protein
MAHGLRADVRDGHLPWQTVTHALRAFTAWKHLTFTLEPLKAVRVYTELHHKLGHGQPTMAGANLLNNGMTLTMLFSDLTDTR